MAPYSIFSIRHTPGRILWSLSKDKFILFSYYPPQHTKPPMLYLNSTDKCGDYIWYEIRELNDNGRTFEDVIKDFLLEMLTKQGDR